MEPCNTCEEKQVSHTETGIEKRCNPKKQPPTLAVLWHPIKRHTHIKRKNKNPAKQIDPTLF